MPYSFHVPRDEPKTHTKRRHPIHQQCTGIFENQRCVEAKYVFRGIQHQQWVHEAMEHLVKNKIGFAAILQAGI